MSQTPDSPTAGSAIVATSKDLSVRLAAVAGVIRERIEAALVLESGQGPLTTLMTACRTSPVHAPDAAGFADLCAQTIACGLLAARLAHPQMKTADGIAALLRTNPFLRELLQRFLDIGRPDGATSDATIDFARYGMNEVVELLDDPNTQMAAVVEEFADRQPPEDAVIYFYEAFLKEYDAARRLQRGVFYTPRPVVSYIVRAADTLLREAFGLADGLADTTRWRDLARRRKDLSIPAGTSPDDDFVQILDPATGTGTFLIEIIDRIHQTLVAKWQRQRHSEAEIDELWNTYVPRHLLTRLHGYELLVAPYAIAHLKIALKLHETGYRFGADEQARVYLTDALAPAQSRPRRLAVPALAPEAAAADEIKRSKRFTVVIGNPPYSGLSSNMGPWIDGLLKGRLPDGTPTQSYYHVDGEALGERKLWLQDDYVKFIRLSQWLLDASGAGIVACISNHGYLDNPTFRGMRCSLMQSFGHIAVLDLHGNRRKKESVPGGGRDVNVFDIQQGVAIGLFTKGGAVRRGVEYSERWGERADKYRWLGERNVGDTRGSRLEPTAPFYLFRPFDQSGAGDYREWTPVNEIMPVNVTGIVTARDDFVIDFDRAALRDRIADLRSHALDDAAIRNKYFVGKGSKKYPPGDSRGWKLPQARATIREDSQWEERFARVLYRPFDVREIYYVPWMVDWPRTRAMPHMLAGENLGLIFMRQVAAGDDYTHVGVSRLPVDNRAFYSNKGIMSFAPLYLYPGAGKSGTGSRPDRWPAGRAGRTPNLDPDFVAQLEAAVDWRFVADGSGDLRETFGAQDVLGYVYGILHCPGYRRKYEAQLRLDFPRIPLPGHRALFRTLAKAGSSLISLHLLEPPGLDDSPCRYTGPRNSVVGRAGWSDGTVWLDAQRTNARRRHRAGKPGITGFMGVSERVWNFEVGGYQVCHKWLRDRKGRTLSDGDIEHYTRMVAALTETLRVMEDIDEVIVGHGGWSVAFRAGLQGRGRV